MGRQLPKHVINAVNSLGGVDRELAYTLINAELARRSLREFIRQAWHVHHSDKLLWSWHLDVLCSHLEAVLPKREINQLIINIPPGMAKSLIVSVYWPAWLWTIDPSLHFLAVAAANDVALRDARRAHEIIESEWYQTSFQPEWSFLDTQDSKGFYANTGGGSRVSRSTGQRVIGLRGDCIIIDDPLDASDAFSDKKALHDHIVWFDQALRTRTTRPDAPFVLIMQRLHEKDLTGHLLAQGGWDHLCLPNEYDGNERVTSIGWSDPRSERNELLFPGFLNRVKTDQIKRRMGDRGYAAQYQQIPSPAEGAIFREPTFQYFDTVPQKLDYIIQSWDFAFKRSTDADFAVGQLWGVKGSYRFLLEQVREKMNLPDCIAAIREMHRRWPGARAVLVEGRANGPAVVRAIQNEIPGVVSLQPEGSKEARAAAVTPNFEAGNVFFPRMDARPWVPALLRELMAFPASTHDDQVDALTQALIWINQNQGQRPWVFRL